MRQSLWFLLCFVIFSVPSMVSAQSPTDRVLTGIPHIAKVIAPLADVDWQYFALTIAGICAVESKCNPNYPHYTGSGAYSQYQGLFQMNGLQVDKAKAHLTAFMPQLEALAQSGKIPKESFDFFKDAIQKGQQQKDPRFHPEYGIILGAVKHIQIHKPIEEKFKNDAQRQAAAHMLAQFSGITEGKIRRGDWTAAITGNPRGDPTKEEAAALMVNKVAGASTVASAVDAAGKQYGKIMESFMNRMKQITQGMTASAGQVGPWQGPDYNPGEGPQINSPWNAGAAMMEQGLLPRQTLPPNTPIPPPSIAPATGATAAQQTAGDPTSASLIERIKAGLGIGGAQSNPSSVPNGTPVGDVFAQPSTISITAKTNIIWTTLNMSRSVPCRVLIDDKVAADGNDGAKLISVDTLAVGSHTLKLICSTAKGEKFEKTETLTVTN